MDTMDTADLESRCKTLQAQLRQAQRSEALGRLVGGVVHDFNNMLTILLGYSEFVVDGVKMDDPMFGPLSEIRRTAQRAAQLATRLLRFSRARPPVLQPLGLNQVLRDMDLMLRRTASDRIALQYTTASNLDMINADLGEIEQIVLNLALNARDAMPRGGKLFVQTANVRLPADPASLAVPAEWPQAAKASALTRGIWRLGPIRPGRYVMLAVADTGCGIDLETQAQIFEPFFTTKEPGKGTGLGLASVEEIVREHDGYIWLHSEPSGGTMFRIFFPRLRLPDSGPRSDTNLMDQLRGWETVLVVEDDEAIRNLARQILQNCGYRVLTADSHGAAVDLCRHDSSSIHMLMTEEISTEANGRQLAAELVPLRPDIKVVLLSDTGHELQSESNAPSRTGILRKPFTPTGLLTKVREVLDR